MAFGGDSQGFLLGSMAIIVLLGIVIGIMNLRLKKTRLQNSSLQKEIDQLRNQLNQAQRMEAVGILAGSIVHNLNNLMAVILGHTRMAMHDVKPDSTAHEELERVVNAGHMVSDLVSEISDFYRQADQARKPSSLAPIIHDTLKLLRDILPPTVKINETLDPDCGPVLATTTGVQQVLMNLCTNSMQAMYRSQGTLDVSLEKARVDDWHKAQPMDLGPGSYAKLTVRDNGRGMENDTLDQIFESYFTKNKNGNPMGIGLSTVYRILEDHDGVAIANSQVGQGTCFDIYFPLIAWGVNMQDDHSKVEEVEAASPALAVVQGSFNGAKEVQAIVPRKGAPTPGTARATILLVDDQEMVANVLTRGLQHLGFRVIKHTDSRRALADFLQTPDIFDVLVTDQIMPHMSGVHLTRKIHAVRNDLPVILTTGFRDSFNEQQARDAGVTEFLLKPASHRDMADLIERVMLRHMKGEN